jgi:hypothetical protein
MVGTTTDSNGRPSRIEATMPGTDEIDPWAGYDPAVRAALGAVSLAATAPIVEALEARGEMVSGLEGADLPQVAKAALDAVADLEMRLDGEGLLLGPLSDKQRARVRAIAEEMAEGRPKAG